MGNLFGYNALQLGLAELETLEKAPGVLNSVSDQARVQLARMAVQVASGDSAGFSAALPAYLDAQLARVDRAGETYDFSSVSHALLGGLLAARHDEPARAREVLEKTRAISLGSGYPEREALWRDFLGTAPVRVWHLEPADGPT